MNSDLISREALKEQFDHLEMVTNNSSVVEQAEYKMLMTCISLIDNAPAVKVPENAVNCVLTMFGKCSYDETGCHDCEIKVKIRKALGERPQGSWNILQKDDNGVHEIECPFCKYTKGGRFANVGITFHKLPPFCEACGADMGKGDVE